MRPLLPLAVFLLAAAPARAQTRSGVVETGAVDVPNGSLSGSLTSGSVPQLINLTVLTPSLTPSPGLTPAPLAAAPALHPVLPAAFAPSAAFVEPAIPRLAPSAVVAAAVPLKTAPAATLARTQNALGEKTDAGKLSDAELIEASKRMFGESTRGGEPDVRLDALTREETGAPDYWTFKREYMRFDAPFTFREEDAKRYEEALGYGVSDPTRARAVVDAAVVLLTDAGVAFTRRSEADDGLVITPDRDGGALNRFAYHLKARHGADVVYAPLKLGYGSAAGFVNKENTLYLPHFGAPDTYNSILHEAQHSNYSARRKKGDLSPFNALALARSGRTIVPRAHHYSGQMSMEELTTHAKALKHSLAGARRAPPVTYTEGFAYLNKAYELQDLRRSASIIASRMLVELDGGAAVEPVTDENTLATLGPVKGGTWHLLWLPWSAIYVPVLDEAPAPPRNALARLFTRKPETPAQKAARRTAEALKSWADETGPLLDALVAGLEADAPDWKGLNPIADKLALAGPKAEKAFKAAR